MNDVDLVRQMTEELCQNDHHEEVLKKHFAPDFTYWTNGQLGDLADLASRLVSYRKTYEYLGVSNWDLIFATDQGVVVSYIFESQKKDADTVRTAVIAIWGVKEGKITSLREVLGPSRESG